MKLFSVYDTAAEAYQKPFPHDSIGAAVRDFATAANDPQTYLSKHPSDYILFHIADFDQITGEITPCIPKAYGKALEYVTHNSNQVT